MRATEITQFGHAPTFLSSITYSFIKLCPLSAMVRPEIDSSLSLRTVFNHWPLQMIEAFVTRTNPRGLTGESVSALSRSWIR